MSTIENWEKEALEENKAIAERQAAKSRATLHPRSKAHRAMADVKTEVWLRDDFTCQYCNFYMKDLYIRWMNGEIGRSQCFLTVDHVLPRALGGRFTVDNLRTACTPCNQAKGFKLNYVSPVQFYRSSPQMVSWPLALLSMWCERIGQRWLRAASYLRQGKQ